MNQTLTEDLAPVSATQETGLLEAANESKSQENTSESSSLPLRSVDRRNEPIRHSKRATTTNCSWLWQC
jgi:hypothetical protein